MADLTHRDINTNFSGLVTSVIIFGVVGGAALLGFESLRQLRRLPTTHFPPFWKSDPKAQHGGPGGVYGRVARDKPEIDPKTAIGIRGQLTCEDWEMGHLYTARCFHHSSPSPSMSRWPLGWAWQALKFNDWFYATHTGMDTVVYVRFLRAGFYWVLLQTLVTAPILLAVHLNSAKTSLNGSVELVDMSQASLSLLVTTPVCPCNATSTLNGVVTNDEKCVNGMEAVYSIPIDSEGCTHIPNERGRQLLWIHLVLLWFLTFSWFFALYWIGKGSLRIRRRWIEELRRRCQAAQEEAKSTSDSVQTKPRRHSGDAAVGEQSAVPLAKDVLSAAHGLITQARGDDVDGWRQRTLLVTNLPPTMRDEASIRRYFEEFLRPDDEGEISSLHTGTAQGSSDTSAGYLVDSKGAPSDQTYAAEFGAVNTEVGRNDEPATGEATGPAPDTHPDRHFRSPVQTVVLVRKMNELSAMLTRRQDVLAQLEAAHIKLAQTVLHKVQRQARKLRGEATPPEQEKSTWRSSKVAQSKLARKLRHVGSPDQSDVQGGDVEKKAASKLSEEHLRLNQLVGHLAQFTVASRFEGGARHSADSKSHLETVWEALSEIPRDLLDPYQPVTRLSSLFRGQKVPTIDYLLTKLNLLTALVTEMRARPPTSYEATSTAFVTFRDPRQARMVWRELKSQIVVKVRLAPEVKDLDWERLMRTSFTGDIVRGFGVNSFFWFFTIIWVVPVNLLATSLFSVQSLEKPFPILQDIFRSHPQLKAFISVTLPTVIVSLLTMAVPELIFQISKRAQGFVTFSALYDQCLCRYWKFVICNVVIFFCIGATAVESVVFQLGASENSLPNVVAYAFPTAAPFYVSYLILGMALHTGFELVGFMIPLIHHLGARKAKTPRTRALKTLPRNFNRYYWLPFHVLILSIVFLFALLNPLVIPFALVYIFVAMVVFKKNFAYQYFRRFNEKEGVIYYQRILRFSLDGLMVAQVVLLVFFSVTEQQAAYIGLTATLLPITVAVKLLGTRLWKSQCRAIEDDEANAVCGIGPFGASTASVERVDDPEAGASSLRAYQPEDARASGRYPTLLRAPQTRSRIINLWNKIHDSFNANGHDKPSYFNHAGIRGSNLNAKTVTQAVASAPVNVAKKTAGKGAKYAHATAVAARGVPAGSYNARESLALSSFPHKIGEERDDGHLAGATAKDLKRFLDGAEERQFGARDKSQATIRALRKGRNSDAPFLSGLDSIASHAPVAVNDDGEYRTSLDDGEYEEMLSISRRTQVEERRREVRKRRAASEGVPVSASNGTLFAGRRAPTDMGNISNVTEDRLPLRPGDDTVDSTFTDEAAAYSNAHIRFAAERAEGRPLDGKNCEAEHEEQSALVKPHASVRWDDTPNNVARYNNPFYSVELDPFLWLPRDPLCPIDLCDTIEWHGSALVSSQGGSGLVGEWDEDQDTCDEDEHASALSNELGYAQATEVGDISALSHSESFRGDEQIIISGTLAQRLQEAEDLDDTQDPATSLPRNRMDDYRKALDEDEEVIAEEDEEAGETTPSLSPATFALPQRHDSLVARRKSSLPRRARSRRWSRSSDGTRAAQNTNSSAPLHLDLGKSTQKTAKDEVDDPLSAHGQPFSPTPGRQRPQQRRDASFAASSAYSHHSGRTEHAAGRPPSPVTMRKALRAEVLQEEYIRTMKDRVRRRREAASQASDAGTSHLEGRHEQGDPSTADSEQPYTASRILERHHAQQAQDEQAATLQRGVSQASRNRFLSVVAAARRQSSINRSTAEPRHDDNQHFVALQELNTPPSADGAAGTKEKDARQQQSTNAGESSGPR